MNTRLGSRVAALLAFIIVAAGCVSSADPPATSAPPATAAAATTSTLPLPPTFASGSLVTEDELILHAAEATARDGSLLFAGMLSGGNPAMVICNQDDPSAGWNDGRTLSLTLRFNSDHPECPDPQYEGHPIGELTFHWTFGSAVYADGEVDVGDCRKLPGAGTVTTGEYRELTNETSDPIERTISHTVEESHSSETSLSETLDLTTGQSIEAGGGVPGIGEGKATVSFEQHFGIEHGSVESSSSTHSETVEDKSTVEPDQIIGAAFTLDDSVTVCAINIHSTVDWSTIHLRVWRHRCGDFCGQSHILQDHGVISSHGRNVEVDFDGVDGIRRLATGNDTRCDRCTFDLGYWGSTGLHDLGWPSHHGRSINLSAERRTTVKDSASVVFLDVTGLDSDCVARTLSAEGTAVSDLDTDGDGRLDGC